MRSRWLTGRAIGFHFLLVGTVGGCLIAGWWQLHQALAGNTLSWAYTVEWPIFAVIAIVGWWYLVHEDPAERAERAEKAARLARRMKRADADAEDAPRSWRAATIDAYEWDEVSDVNAARVAAAARAEYESHLARLAADEEADRRHWRRAKGAP